MSTTTKKKLIMRIQVITLLLFTVCLHISAAGFGQRITISEKNATLEKVLSKIEQQSGYDVFMQTELLARSNKLSLSIENLTLEKTLNKVFKNQPLTYAIIGHTIVLKEKITGNTAGIKKEVATASQSTVITGTVIDADTKEPLIGASVAVKGSSNAASTSLNGTFKLKVTSTEGTVLVISYIGYVRQEITVSQNANLGEIQLKASANAMNEVNITSDVVIDRKTPVAVSTINAQFIEEKLGNQDIPELLQGTPGIMATAQGGGYGDSRVSIRGFSSGSKKGNVALTINGIPVNDPESGSAYWSDFTGLADVITSVQVQRGLGASKVIVPSFGGTINITTRGTDTEKGGYIAQYIGSDGYQRTGVLISTGLDKNGWAATFQGSRTMGNGNADGLKFLGYNYFFNLSKVLSKNQTLSFDFMGAHQTHGQRFEQTIATMQNAPQGIRFNDNWGVKDGKDVNPYNNFFSKPLASITHHWDIDQTSSLSTILYATYGTGGGGSIGGTLPNRISNIYSPFDFTAAEKTNAASPDGSAATYFYAAHNDHKWYGLRSTYKKNLTNNLDFSAGVDLRYYEGTHYEVVTDLLGADYVLDKYKGSAALGTSGGDINNPLHRAVVGDKIDYYNKDYVASGGAFMQTEYSKKDFSVFVTLSGTGSGDKRTDLFNYLNSDPNQSSRYVNFFTYQAKGGANYNLNSQMNLFANVGYITKPPYFDNVFEKFTNKINDGTVPEKLLSYELGYGFKSSMFTAKLNLYRTLYKDESFSNSYSDATTLQLYSVNITGVTEMHQGAELELKLRPVKDVTIGGMLSVGDWYYTKDAGPATVYNNQQQVVTTLNKVYLKDIKVGDAPQTTAALSLDVNVMPQLKLGANYFYTANYTSNFLFTNLTIPGLTPYKIPNNSLVNLNAVFRFKIAGLDASFIANVMNVFNRKYISDGYDANATGQAANINAYYGIGRTFTTGLKIKF
ncbi:TonB-dependent receptor domain-containing protein [Pedobacter sp. L105]|uniref:TonB-dependent receptor domain-containing protein n=1 Tax=Pedobacter sp. L105 TaxID=1641871 RepID=UPI00131C1C8D|nr:TonB-dependent receptor [Pedobacter sp. L105]